MNDEPFGGPPRTMPRITLALIIINVAIYFLAEWLETRRILPVMWYFALHLEGLRHGYVWQFISYQFLHGGLLHLFLNCWGIYVFGPAVETALGKRSYLLLYLLSGVFGGMLQMLGSILAHDHFGGPVVGASAGLFGLIAAFTALYPETRMTVLLFFVIPVRMTANTLLTAAALISVVGMVLSLGNIAHAAHLGGLIGGLAFLRWKLWRMRAR